MLKPYQQSFIDMMIQQKVLQFGTFILKSGRQSPYFFNLGQIHTGNCLAKLGHFYAEAIIDAEFSFDVIFGPAYKGIPIACATAMGLSHLLQREIPFSFNRKEAKDHGEGGCVVGAPLNQRILLVDDVMTAGTATRAAIDLIHAAGGELVGIVLALDREEKGRGDSSAMQEIQQAYGIKTCSIVNLSTIQTYLTDKIEPRFMTAIQQYREQYGV